MYKQWKSPILFVKNGLRLRKMTDELRESFQLQMIMKNSNFRMFYPNERITICQKVIFGFQYSLVRHRIISHVFNDVLAVLFCYLFRCY